MHKLLIYNYLNILFITALCTTKLTSQDKLKSIIHDKISNIKEKVLDDSLRISGSINASTTIRPYSISSAKFFEYRLNASCNVSYRGLSIPITYSLSNGRSLYRINGPNINTPKFSNLGVSPKYKNVTGHFGNRIMSFSKYTYDNIRFKGAGLEYKFTKPFFIKSFYGHLTPLQENTFLLTDQTNTYTRIAYGLYGGYINDNNEFSAIVFKATDSFDSLKHSMIVNSNKPKENVTLSVKLKKQLFKNFSIEVDRALTAYSKNILDDRYIFNTGHTIYNMFGFFEKKISTIYAYATNAMLSYSVDQTSYSIRYEKVDKGYKSLGSLFFDNDFYTTTFLLSKPISEKIHFSSEVGLRHDGLKLESLVDNKNIVGRLNINYQINDNINSSINYSNFRNAQRSFFQSLNSFEADSIHTIQVNNQLNITTNFILSTDKSKILSINYGLQHSDRVLFDTISSNFSTKTNLCNIVFSSKKDKLTSSYVISTIINNNDILKNVIISPSYSLTYLFSDVLTLNNILTYSLISNKYSNINTLQLKNDIIWKPSKRQQFQLSNVINMRNQQATTFRLAEYIIQVEGNYRF